MGTCLNTWNEHAWHWVTLVSMLIFVHFLSVWGRAAHHFCTCTHFLSWHKHETNAYTHIHPLTCAHTCMCICSHCDTLFLSFPLSHTIHNSHPLYAQMAMSVLVLWWPYWLSALLMLTSKKWLHWFCSVLFFDDHLHLMRHNMAAVSKCSSLFLLYLKIKLKRTLSYCQKYNYWKSAIGSPVTICANEWQYVLWMLIYTVDLDNICLVTKCAAIPHTLSLFF